MSMRTQHVGQLPFTPDKIEKQSLLYCRTLVMLLQKALTIAPNNALEKSQTVSCGGDTPSLSY